MPRIPSERIRNLDIAVERLAGEHGVHVATGRPRVAYRTTLLGRARREYRHVKQSGGPGQFAQIVLEVGPAARGAGLVFADRTRGGVVPRPFAQAVERGVREAMANGLLGGHPVVDVAVALLDGAIHPKDFGPRLHCRPMTPLYTSNVNAIGGRAGHIKSDDGTLDLPLSVPKGMGGPGAANATNPEQLFAAGYAACFGGAVGLVGRTQKLTLGVHDITALVSIGKDDTGGFGLAVELRGHFPELAREQAEAVMAAAHQVCPYSKATRGNIEVTLTVI